MAKKSNMTPSRNAGGGGVMSKQHRHVTTRHGSPNTRKVSPSAVADIGIKKGNHVSEGNKTVKRPADPLYKETKDFVRLGNDVAKNVGKGGPGAGRVVMPTGSQMQHGPANPGMGMMEKTPGGGPGGFGFKGGK